MSSDEDIWKGTSKGNWRWKHQCIIKRLLNKAKRQKFILGHFQHWGRKTLNNVCTSCFMKEARIYNRIIGHQCVCLRAAVPGDGAWLLLWCHTASSSSSLSFHLLQGQQEGRGHLGSRHGPPRLTSWNSVGGCLGTLKEYRSFFSSSLSQWSQKMAFTCWTWQPRSTPQLTISASPSGGTWSSLHPSAGRRTPRWGSAGVSDLNPAPSNSCWCSPKRENTTIWIVNSDVNWEHYQSIWASS